MSINLGEGSRRSKLLVLVSKGFSGFFIMSFIGYQVDRYLENRYLVVTLVGVLLGFVWSIYETIKVVKWLNRHEH